MVNSPDAIHRATRLVVEQTGERNVFRAEQWLRRLAVQVVLDPACAESAALQAAVLTIVNAGHRTLLGGVRVVAPPSCRALTPLAIGGTLSAAVTAYGGRVVEQPVADIPTILVGRSPPFPVAAGSIRVEVTGWSAAVSPVQDSSVFELNDALAIAGVLGGAIAVSEIFGRAVSLHPEACQRQIGLSLWDLDPAYDWRRRASGEPVVDALPDSLWLIGLGHLGQGYLWSLSTLPFASPCDVAIWLQDFDRVGKETLSTGLLTFEGDLGHMKTRAAAVRLERLGFRTRIIERKLTRSNALGDVTPTLVLAGVDSTSSRIEVAEAFAAGTSPTSIVDVGLGAQPTDFDQLTLHSSPFDATDLRRMHAAEDRERKRMQAFTDSPDLDDIAAASSLDRCGIVRFANTAVGVPYVGAAAGAVVVADILRRLSDRLPMKAFAFNLRNPALRIPPSVHHSRAHPITFTGWGAAAAPA